MKEFGNMTVKQIISHFNMVSLKAISPVPRLKERSESESPITRRSLRELWPEGQEDPVVPAEWERHQVAMDSAEAPADATSSASGWRPSVRPCGYTDVRLKDNAEAVASASAQAPEVQAPVAQAGPEGPRWPPPNLTEKEKAERDAVIAHRIIALRQNAQNEHGLAEFGAADEFWDRAENLERLHPELIWPSEDRGPAKPLSGGWGKIQLPPQSAAEASRPVAVATDED